MSGLGFQVEVGGEVRKPVKDTKADRGWGSLPDSLGLGGKGTKRGSTRGFIDSVDGAKAELGGEVGRLEMSERGSVDNLLVKPDSHSYGVGRTKY